MGEKKYSIEDIQLFHDQCGDCVASEAYGKWGFESKRRRIVEKWLNNICEGGSSIVLDVGSAHGQLTRPVAKKSKVLALELRGEYLLCARQNGLIPIRCNVAEGIPLADEAADVVVAAEILEHVLRPEELIAECHRVLKPKGKLIVTTPNLASLLSIIYIVFRDLPCPAVFQDIHFRFFTFRSLGRLLRNFGFSIIGTATNEVLPGYAARYIPKIGMPICKALDFLNVFLNAPFKRFGLNVMLLAQKEERR